MGTAKLTIPQVYAIRALQGRMSQPKIAALFGVSAVRVHMIHHRASWGWLPEVDEQGQLLMPL